MEKLWTVDVVIPPPMAMTKKGWRPQFGIISKNARMPRGNAVVWPRESKEWVAFEARVAMREALAKAGVMVGDGTYHIVLEVLVPDRRRLDGSNFVALVADALQLPLQCDDSKFTFEVPLPRVAPLEDCGIHLTISKTAEP